MLVKRIVSASILVMIGSVSQAQSWVDDWFTSSTSGSSGSFETQQRGFYTGGSFQGRWRMSNDHVMSITAPRYRVGCGGIDLFGGGFSFLDEDYLVDKFQRILQAAPAMAFDLALQEFCKPCLAGLQTLEDLSDQLNSIQVNDCRMSQRLVQTVRHQDASMLMDEQMKSLSNFSISQAYQDNYHAVQEQTRASGGVVQVDTRGMLDNCPAEFRDMFAGGSVVENASELVGLDDYANIMRGLIGDAVVSFPPGENVPRVEVMDPCPGNDELSPEDFMTGQMDQKGTNDQCTASGMTGVLEIVEDRLQSIADAMRAGNALSADDQAFIESSPLPVYGLLRDAITAGTVDVTIQVLTEPLALSFAHRILDDLYRTTGSVLQQAAEIGRDGGNQATSDPNRCDTQFLKPAIVGVQQMLARTKKYRHLAQTNYMKTNQEMVAHLTRARTMYELKKQTLNSIAAPAE